MTDSLASANLFISPWIRGFRLAVWRKCSPLADPNKIFCLNCHGIVGVSPYEQNRLHYHFVILQVDYGDYYHIFSWLCFSEWQFFLKKNSFGPGVQLNIEYKDIVNELIEDSQ